MTTTRQHLKSFALRITAAKNHIASHGSLTMSHNADLLLRAQATVASLIPMFIKSRGAFSSRKVPYLNHAVTSLGAAHAACLSGEVVGYETLDLMLSETYEVICS